MKLIAVLVMFALSHAHVSAGGLAVPVVSPLTVGLALASGCAVIAVALIRALPRSCPHPHARGPVYVITGAAVRR